MGFANVDEQELGLGLVGLVDALQVASLATERRSGVAAEDQHHRFLALEAG
jgi:hypothetical protein